MENSSSALTELAALLEQGSAPLDRSMLLFSECLQQEDGIADVAMAALDELAESVSMLHDEDETGTSLPQLVDAVFVGLGFSGDVENYHAEENSFLDRVIEQRLGMPISLGAVVVALGARLGFDLFLIGLPGHVVVGVNDQPDTFIDAFAGTVVDVQGLVQRMRSIFGTDADLSADQLVPMSVSAVITRVSNNLMRTWSGDSQKFDRLLEVRAALPLDMSDQRMLVGIAEARARFDIAATVRAAIDPDDPKIDQMWGRLN